MKAVFMTKNGGAFKLRDLEIWLLIVGSSKDSFITIWTEMSNPVVTQVNTRYQMKARGIIFRLIPPGVL